MFRLVGIAGVLQRFARPSLQMVVVRHASKASAGSAASQKSNTRKKSLGLKKSGDQFCRPGDVLITQRGTTFHPGLNTHMGRDHTIHAACDGYVKFCRNLRPGRTRKRWRRWMSIEPLGSDGHEVARWHKAQTEAYHQLLKRKRLEFKGLARFERVPAMLKRLAKAKLKEQGLPHQKLDGDWKAILRTRPRSERRMRIILERAATPYRNVNLF